MCGTHNTFVEADHRTLDAGAHFDAEPYTRIGTDLRKATIAEPGKYTIWLTYRFCGYANAGGETLDVVKRDVFVGVAVSNAVHVEVEP